MNFSEIKVVINNRNRLTTTKGLVDKLLLTCPDEQIIIIDNGSTYEPLLQWYDTIKNFIDIRFHGNEGHLALWATKLDKELGEYFVYTDSDIILPDSFPTNWKEIMFNLLQKYPEYKKVALGIRVDDIPLHYRYINQVLRNESYWWLHQIDYNVYQADTDTTFFMIKNFGDNCYKSLRICTPEMMCKHHGWYLDLDDLDDEEKYYLEHLENKTTQYSKQHKNPELYPNN